MTAFSGNRKWMGGAIALSLSILVTPATVAAPFAYVANANDNTVSVIDAATHAIVGGPIAVGLFPTDVAINPAGTRVYVANYYGESVSVIDTASNSVIATVADIPAHGLAMDSTGSRLFVAGYHSVYVIDTAINVLIGDPIAIATADLNACLTASGKISYDAGRERLYVPAAPCQYAETTAGTLSIIDTHAKVAIGNMEVGTSPTSTILNANGTRVYVTNWWEGSISVVDVDNAVVTQTIALGNSSYPSDAVIDPAGAHLYIANNGGSVTVIDTADGSVEGTPIAVDSGSYGITMTSDGAHLYTANQFGDSVSVIDTATRTVEQLSIGVGRNPVALALTRNDALFANGFEQQN